MRIVRAFINFFSGMSLTTTATPPGTPYIPALKYNDARNSMYIGQVT